MQDGILSRYREAPPLRRAFAFAVMTAFYGLGIFWFAFWLVTLQKAFQFTGFWPTLEAFAASTGFIAAVLVAIYWVLPARQ